MTAHNTLNSAPYQSCSQHLLNIIYQLAQSIKQLQSLKQKHQGLISTMIDIRNQCFRDPYNTDATQQLEICQSHILANIKNTTLQYEKIKTFTLQLNRINQIQEHMPRVDSDTKHITPPRPYSP